MTGELAIVKADLISAENRAIKSEEDVENMKVEHKNEIVSLVIE